MGYGEGIQEGKGGGGGIQERDVGEMEKKGYKKVQKKDRNQIWTMDEKGHKKGSKQENTLLDGTNVRLNWNIESDLNVYWIKFKNFLSLY